MARRMCYSTLRPSGEPDEELMARQIPERKFNNTLLMMQPDGSFTNAAPEMGLEKAGWAWNARFADLDNDEYQDLFVVNRTWRSNQRLESNYFFRNNAGTSFENLTDEYGLSSYLATSSYTYIDIDHDGDLDIVVIPVNGPVSVYRNNNDSGNRIAFSLRDTLGNRFGIGGKIIVSYGDEPQNRQIREIKASGGFISYDAPIAYFGLGTFDTVNEVEVVWSTGERTVFNGPFAQGAHYTIDRTQTQMADNRE